ncbi:MAG: DEAD/DEAH box helicase [Planctomycetes bacterium]|nr:DEAD/DEAH box helicase [Planctomycetota bacterium]
MTSLKFNELGLPAAMVDSLSSFGYENPSPIQAEAIPHLLEKRDIIGQAQTGTGKTAAFALPILANIDLENRAPQVLVLAPTRELAIQVAESFQKYARSMPGFHVLPIYGGQAYQHQLRPLKKGVHVVVGTPGRVLDHIKRGTLKLDQLTTLVLDEADEMLRMGFIDDVNFVLENCPDERQIALFSATMPREIKRIADKYLNSPAEVKIKVTQTTADTVRQRYQIVTGRKKIDALGRLLEFEDVDAMIVFVRTKNATTITAEQLEARGYSVAALNGDVPQSQREQIIKRLKKGALDIIIATDVAARGLDVTRVSHVVNYDAPTDPEAYVHRIGRTGRAGTTGDAILFVTPREKRLLRMLEKVTRADIKPMKMPTTDEINEQRIERFKNEISAVIEDDKLEFNLRLIDSYLTDHPETEAVNVAAALAFIAQGKKPMLVSKNELVHDENFAADRNQREPRDSRGRGREDRGPRRDKRGGKVEKSTEDGMERYRVEIGHRDQVRPGSIVAVIAKTSGLQGKHIGRIEIYDNFTTVDLPKGMPGDVLEDLGHVKINNRALRMSRV